MQAQLTAQIIADLVQPEEVRISKDGKLVTYTARALTRQNTNPVKSCAWLAEVGKENSAKKLTAGDSFVSSLAFSPDGKSIALLSDRTAAGKDRDLYSLKLDDPSNAVQLSFSAEHGDIYGENIRYSQLWSLDVGTGKVTRLMSEEADVVYFDPNTDCTQIFYCTRDEPNITSPESGQDIKVLDVTSGVSSFIYRALYRVEGFSWSEKGVIIRGPVNVDGGVFWRSPAIHHVYQGGTTRLAYGETNCAGALQSCWGRPVVLVQDGMRDSLRTIEDRILFESTQTLTGYDLALIDETPVLALIKDSTHVPPEVYSIVNGQTCQLSRHSQHITDMKIALPKIIEEEHDGLPMSGIWSIPTPLQSEFGQKPLPTVVLCKGGPTGRVTDCFGGGLLFLAPYLIAQGYLILQPNYRGCNSHGDTYARAVDGNGAISYDDVIWHTKKGVKDGIIDPNRVAIAGWSQGGYLTYLAAVRDSTFHFTAAAAGAGVADLYTETVTADLPGFGGSLMGFKPWDTDVLKNHNLYHGSPIHHVQNVKTPVLILHGEEDARVPVQNALIFAQGMKEHGKTFEMAIYPREQHGAPFMWERSHWVDLLERLGKFLKKHMA